MITIGDKIYLLHAPEPLYGKTHLSKRVRQRLAFKKICKLSRLVGETVQNSVWDFAIPLHRVLRKEYLGGWDK